MSVPAEDPEWLPPSTNLGPPDTKRGSVGSSGYLRSGDDTLQNLESERVPYRSPLFGSLPGLTGYNILQDSDELDRHLFAYSGNQPGLDWYPQPTQAAPQSLENTAPYRKAPNTPARVYLARGSAADVWRVVNQKLNPNTNLPDIWVSKKLRLSPNDLDDPFIKSEEVHHSQITYGETSGRSFLRTYMDQINRWKQTNHTNVVRVYGNHDNQTFDLNVEFCFHGSVREYIKVQPNGMVPKHKIIRAVLNGLDYLHSQNPPIIHGGLNAGKVFVTENHEVKIGEFGLTALCYQEAPCLPSITFAGFSRWMSPELLDINPDHEDVMQPTKASDIWALGCTLFEIIAEKIPYYWYTHDIRIQRAILDGQLPGDLLHLKLETEFDIRSTLQSCWSEDPSARPTAGLLLSRLFGAQFTTPDAYQLDPTLSLLTPSASGSVRSFTVAGSTRRRPNVCDICGKEVRRPGALEDHMRTHTGERPYECPHCPRVFMTNVNMKRHIANIHSLETRENPRRSGR